MLIAFLLVCRHLDTSYYNPDNHDGVITHLEPDILECEVKWALASLQTKLVEVMEFQLSYFKSWKMMLWKCCTQYASKFGKLSSGHRTGKGQLSFQYQRKAIPKNARTTTQLHLSHTLVMFKILQARLQQYMNCELPDVQDGFRKGRGTRDQISNIQWIIKKAREFQKTSVSALLTMPKPLIVWITINCGKFWKRWEYQTTWPASWETCMQVRKQQLELDMEQQTGFK